MVHELTRSLFKQGASHHFLGVLNWNKDNRRNSTREVVDRFTKNGDIDIEELKKGCGSFSRDLLEGNLGEAWYRADGDNTYIMSEMYELWEIEMYIGDDPRNYKHESVLHLSWRAIKEGDIVEVTDTQYIGLIGEVIQVNGDEVEITAIPSGNQVTLATDDVRVIR